MREAGLQGSPPAGTRDHRFLAVLMLLAVGVGFFVNLGSVPLFDLDEGAFSEATREMFERGDFISTFLNGRPRYDKPILIYWLQAASVTVFGLNEFALRLPSALSATLWVLLIGWFVRRVAGLGQGLAAALIAATTLMVTVMGKAATADALLNVLIAASGLMAYLYLREGRRRFLYAAFVSAALGFLAKGPVAVLVPAATTLLYSLSRREFAAWARAQFDPRGLALFLLIALPWYVAQYLKEGDAFIQGFFFKHNIDRFSSPMEGHGGAVFYYLPVLLVGVLPHTALLLKALGRVREVWRDDLQRYMLLWLGFVFVFFSLSGTKLPHYLNYGYTGAIVLMAAYAGQLRSRVLALLPALLFTLLLLGLGPILARVGPGLEDDFYRALLADPGGFFSPAYYAYFAAAAAVLGYFMWERRLALALKLWLAGIVVSLGMSGFVLPLAGEVQQAPIKAAAGVASGRTETLVMWGLNTPSFSVYVDRVVERREPRSGEVVLTRRTRLSLLPDHEILYHNRGVVLARLLP